MARTGIDKYDELSGVVGLIDVDGARVSGYKPKLEKAYEVYHTSESKIERIKRTLPLIS